MDKRGTAEAMYQLNAARVQKTLYELTRKQNNDNPPVAKHLTAALLHDCGKSNTNSRL